MYSKVFDTSEISDGDQYNYWNDSVCDVFTQMKCEKVGSGNKYRGILKHCDLNIIDISVVECEASSVYHSKSHVSMGVNDVFLMHLQLNGKSLNQQSGNSALLSSGDFALCQSTMPYSLVFDQPIKMMVIKIPRSVLQQHIPHPEKLVGLKVDHSTEVSQILITYLLELWKHKANFESSSHLISMSNIVLSLLSTTYELAFPNVIKANRSSVRSAHNLRLKAYINKNLTNPELTPSNIASANRVSKRYVRMLFNDDGTTCGKYILQKRIDAVAKELTNPLANGLKISEIAYRWGFNNLSHFSKSFKKHQGMSPTEFRHSQAEGT